jgi:DNA-3-methyladenine glycosylase II
MNKLLIQLNTNDKNVKMLKQADSELGKLITRIGNIDVPLRENRFEALVKSIIGQQLSLKAANTIFNKLQILSKEIEPEVLMEFPDEEMKKTGTSSRKASYIKDLCHKVMTGEIALQKLDVLSNSEVISALTNIKGVGQWTAEMFLIFSLGRLDVLSLGDAGLQRTTKWLYQIDKKEDGREWLQKKAMKWEPYYTVASLYLWEALNKGYVDSFGSIDDLLLQ